jgi:hypothetical protein
MEHGVERPDPARAERARGPALASRLRRSSLMSRGSRSSAPTVSGSASRTASSATSRSKPTSGATSPNRLPTPPGVLLLVPCGHERALVRTLAPRTLGLSAATVGVASQVRRARGGHRDERTASWRVMTRDEASVVGILPHRQARTRRPPRLKHLSVGAGRGTNPLEKVEDEGVAGVRHSGLRGLPQAGHCFASRLTPKGIQRAVETTATAAAKDDQR